MEIDQMDSDPIGNRRQAGMQISDPMQMLEQDHGTVRQLFQRMFDSQAARVKHQCGLQILQMLEMHTQLEDACFYPSVEQVDPQLIAHSRQEHEEADQLIQQLKGMDLSDPRCEDLFRQLADSVLHHIEEEESNLFPKVRQSSCDLEAIAMEMQSWEANMVGDMARSSDRSGMRPGS